MNINVSKILSICYLLLILPVPFIFPGDVTSFINLGVSLFYFSSLHWGVSKNPVNTYREKLFEFFSFLTLLNFIGMSLFALQGSEGAGYTSFALLMFIPIPVFISLFFGLFSLLRTNKKMFYYFLILIPITLVIIYFASDKHSSLFGLFKFMYSMILSILWLPAEVLKIF